MFTKPNNAKCILCFSLWLTFSTMSVFCFCIMDLNIAECKTFTKVFPWHPELSILLLLQQPLLCPFIQLLPHMRSVENNSLHTQSKHAWHTACLSLQYPSHSHSPQGFLTLSRWTFLYLSQTCMNIHAWIMVIGCMHLKWYRFKSINRICMSTNQSRKCLFASNHCAQLPFRLHTMIFSEPAEHFITVVWVD